MDAQELLSALGGSSPLLRRERDNLYFTLRHIAKQNSSSDKPTPYPAKTIQKLDPGAWEHDLAVFAYVGDVQLRFVFIQPDGDSKGEFTMAKMADLKRLDLEPEAAFAVACENIRSGLPAPKTMEQPAGFYQVGGGNGLDENTQFWFMKSYWVEQAKKHQAALVAAFPRRGTVYFAPYGNDKAIEAMRKRALELHKKAHEQSISGKLFGFTGKKWKVYKDLA